MARTRKIKTQDGREIDATVIGFRSQSEEFNQYLLDDQTLIKLKVVVTEIVRLEGEYDQFGNPQYIVAHQPIITVDSPDELRRE